MTERATIVEAATQLLREHGSGAVTTRRVARAAGVQAPTIYRLFGDKDGLVDAVAEQLMAEHVAAKSAAEPLDDPVEDLRAGWFGHVEFGLANPDLHALLAGPGRTSPATEAGVVLLRAKVRRLAAAGLLRVDEDRAVAMIHAAGAGTVLALSDMPPDARDPKLADAMFDAVCAAVLTDAPVTQDGGPRAVAVTFAAVVSELPALSDAERALMTEWVARALRQMG
ncbi:TetR/AcrR family transcriptional regulator [Pseudonocardia endophytica]|uniref:TetR family transcriptional regulator n=1 Tax=Pseudonocardia endophytica TaxID=401976 RepID=A0A4R1HIU6_PSEEN|nr:TetR/AcrR family transcriptional regulator [Pseudonocardia endophytica]TCK21748.1 TetR family transcriptional regulator [Pseudonocardia endophytica]